MLHRVRRQPVAAARPALRTAEREHPCVLARAVVLRRRVGFAGPHSSSSSLGGRLRQQAADGGELLRPGEVGCRGDRDLLVVRSSRARTSGSAWNGFADERRIGDEAGVAGLSTTAPVAHGDGVDAVAASTTAPRRTTIRDRLHARAVYARRNRVTRRTCERSMAIVWSDDYRPFESPTAGLRGRRHPRRFRDGAAPRARRRRPAPDRRLLRERAATTTELAENVGLAKGTVAHHLKVLESAGLVKVVRTRRVRALTESFYGRVARLYVLKSADDKPQARVRLSAADVGEVPAAGRGAAPRLRGLRVGARRGVRAGRDPLPERRFEVKLRRPGGLWLHRDFLKLWAAETISVFGSQVDDSRSDSSRSSSWTRARSRSPSSARSTSRRSSCFTLPAGVWVDRLRRRPILISADFGRAGLLATVPLAYALTH